MGLAIETKHPEYNRWCATWQKMRDVIAGQDRIHEAGKTWLPQLGGQDDTEYRAYLCRSSFYEATARTVDALTGAVFRKDPEKIGSEALSQQLDNIDLAGTPLDTFAKVVVGEVLGPGRYGVLVDAPPEETGELARPYWTGYAPEDIFSWYTIRNGATILVRVVLREKELGLSPTDEFILEETERYRVLDLDETGHYRVRVFQQIGEGKEMTQIGDDALPRRGRNERLREIPFCFFGAMNVLPEVSKPPLLGMANMNLAHYRKAADYAHGLHFTALPTPWLADKSIPKNKVFRIGSQTAWTMSELGSAGMLEFSGAGMGALKDAIKDDEERLAILGAAMFGDKKGIESADAMRIREAAKSASLASVANTTSAGLTKLAKWHAWWNGDSDADVEATEINLNEDFVESRMDPAELKELVAARQAGEMSREAFLHNLERGEMLPGTTVEDELAALEEEDIVRTEREEARAQMQEAQQAAALLMNEAERRRGGRDVPVEEVA